jgi:hypothetical protein
MTTGSDADAEVVAAVCRRRLDLGAPPGDEYRYAHLSLCVLDAVFSIGVRYQATAATVRRYARWASLVLTRGGSALPTRAAQQPLGAFVAHVADLGPERFAREVASNRQRTSTRSGILKAEAALRFARALGAAGVTHFQDVAGVAHDPALDAALRAIPGQGSGISVAYFFMLAGDDQLVKPDRMLLRFLAAALARNVTVKEAQDLVAGACEILALEHPHLTPRSLDHAIWGYQRLIPSR